MLKLSTQNFVNGTNVKDLSKDQCINMIADAKDDIARLKALDVGSTAVDKQIAALEAGIKGVVEVLDAKK